MAAEVGPEGQADEQQHRADDPREQELRETSVRPRGLQLVDSPVVVVLRHLEAVEHLVVTDQRGVNHVVEVRLVLTDVALERADVGLDGREPARERALDGLDLVAQDAQRALQRVVRHDRQVALAVADQARELGEVGLDLAELLLRPGAALSLELQVADLLTQLLELLIDGGTWGAGGAAWPGRWTGGVRCGHGCSPLPHARG